MNNSAPDWVAAARVRLCARYGVLVVGEEMKQRCYPSHRVEKTDIDSLKGQVSGELEQAVTAHNQARQALLKPLREYRDSLEELAKPLRPHNARTRARARPRPNILAYHGVSAFRDAPHSVDLA